jgi:hypothetical protein
LAKEAVNKEKELKRLANRKDGLRMVLTIALPIVRGHELTSESDLEALNIHDLALTAKTGLLLLAAGFGLQVIARALEGFGEV